MYIKLKLTLAKTVAKVMEHGVYNLSWHQMMVKVRNFHPNKMLHGLDPNSFYLYTSKYKSNTTWLKGSCVILITVA